ncbi:hypothetical protein FHS77_001986 [Paenochrobactrum gallinarii]|uniref:Uncharacterized protein n=1 Tax=Paenochrobactrum gallinarii TaxID=643673 RepID=A0A841M565_9HYPH|nr:hypothetical protein [Paenochrobactrum gallinarii]MBB6261431.1 hypothetical protein [Paenochrobactrum gallinarii]
MDTWLVSEKSGRTDRLDDKGRHNAVIRATCDSEVGNPAVIPAHLFE